MQIRESVGVNYGFIDLLSDETILLRNDKVLNVNTAMLRLLGGEANTYIGKTFYNLVNTSVDIKNITIDTKTNSKDSFSGIIKNLNGEKILINFNIARIDDITYMLIIKGKEERTCNKCSSPYEIKHDESDEALLWILSAAWDAIYIYNEEEKIIFANNAAAELMGFSDHKELLGQKLLDIMVVHPDYKDEICKRRYSILHNTTVLPFYEQKLIKKDGSVIIAEISAMSYVKNDSKNVMLIARDITEKKQAVEDRIQLEEALEYDKLKTEFFSNISHEIRTPLNIILGTLQLIDSIHNGPEKCAYYGRFDKYSKIIRQNCYRLLKLINNLIDITRIDSGCLDINLINADIVSVVEDICESVVDYAETYGISILFDTNVEEKVMAFDPDKIERIILNLLSNAIKFNKAGGRIDINLYVKTESIIISVKDNGTGIPKEMKERIFDRFKQVDNLFTREAEGSGVGLSIVKYLVNVHGGTIKVESELNEGSNFIVELPSTLIPEDKNKNIEHQFKSMDKIERIKIELSDIYSVE